MATEASAYEKLTPDLPMVLMGARRERAAKPKSHWV